MNLKGLGDSIGLEEDEYLELLHLFLDSGATEIAKLKKGLSTGHSGQVARSAHTLNGAAGNLGILSIHEVARRIENAAKRDRLDAVVDDVAFLDESYRQLSQWCSNDPHNKPLSLPVYI